MLKYNYYLPGVGIVFSRMDGDKQDIIHTISSQIKLA